MTAAAPETTIEVAVKALATTETGSNTNVERRT